MTHKVRLTVEEDHELFEARSLLLTIAARAGLAQDREVEELARRAFSTLVTLTSPAFTGIDYTLQVDEEAAPSSMPDYLMFPNQA